MVQQLAAIGRDLALGRGEIGVMSHSGGRELTSTETPDRRGSRVVVVGVVDAPPLDVPLQCFISALVQSGLLPPHPPPLPQASAFDKDHRPI